MRLVIPLLGSVGLLLVYSGLTDRRAGGRSAILTRLDRIAFDAGIGSGGSRLMLVSALCGLAFGVLVTGLTASAVVGGVFLVIGVSAPFSYARSRQVKRMARLREEWPGAIASLVAAIRAGVSLPEACTGLSKRAGAGLKPAFEAFTSTYRATGSFAAGIQRMRDVANDPVADRVTVVLAMAHEVGGTDLVRVLRTLADLVRNDLRVRREIEARWSWTVTAARVAAAAPWIVLLVMSTRPEAVRAYNSAGGAATILAGAAATFVGYRLMLRAARLPENRRFAS